MRLPVLLAFLLACLVATAASAASAIVIRHDVDDEKYRILASDFPALADMPSEGHGALIAPHRVITAAHGIPRNITLTAIEVGGVSREVEGVFIHPGAKPPPQEMVGRALSTGDWILPVFSRRLKVVLPVSTTGVN